MAERIAKAVLIYVETAGLVLEAANCVKATRVSSEYTLLN